MNSQDGEGEDGEEGRDPTICTMRGSRVGNSEEREGPSGSSVCLSLGMCVCGHVMF